MAYLKMHRLEAARRDILADRAERNAVANTQACGKVLNRPMNWDISKPF